MVWISYILKHFEGVGRLCSDSNKDQNELQVSLYVWLLLEVSVGLNYFLSQERHFFVVFWKLFDSNLGVYLLGLTIIFDIEHASQNVFFIKCQYFLMDGSLRSSQLMVVIEQFKNLHLCYSVLRRIVKLGLGFRLNLDLHFFWWSTLWFLDNRRSLWL